MLRSRPSASLAATLAAVAPATALVVAGLATLWSFTAEDAYIVARYAENFAQHGRLHFNLGEPVNALTSPLHGLLASALAFVGPPVAIYKWIGALCLAAVVGLVGWTFRGRPWAQAGALLVVAAPCVAMWAVGGLETPLLMLWATALAVLALREGPVSPRRAYAVAAIAALAVLTRYDAVLFAGPLALGTLIRLGADPRQRRHVAGAVVLGAVPVLAWLGIAWAHYGDPLPTSFYVKTPGESNLALNGWYVAQYLAFVGAAPLAVLAALRWRQRRPVEGRVRVELAVGLACVGLYSLTAATTHMMFGFRLGVPYVPVLALVVGHALARVAPEASGAPRPSLRRQRLGWALALGALAVFHVGHLRYIQQDSINGLALGLAPASDLDMPRPGGDTIEYQREGAASYTAGFMTGLETAADAIRTDWAGRASGADRAPRVWTFAAGVMPYAYPEAYVYEVLVSYRKVCSLRYHKALAADYLHVFEYRGREPREFLPRWRPGRYEEVLRQDVRFDGRDVTFAVYHNTDPQPNPLPARITDPCPPEAEWASPVVAAGSP